MQKRWTRRELMQMGMVAGAVAFSPRDLAFSAQFVSKADPSPLAIPGPFPGRVVEVAHPGSIAGGKYQAGPVRDMMRRGMASLTGEDDWAAAWKKFVSPGEVVGIKLNPVGAPRVISAPEVVREIISGLNAAGIPNKDIVLYDRYRDQFFRAGFHKWAEGVRTAYAAQAFENIQQNIEGYDPEHYMEMALTLPGYDISNERARRSYAARFITRDVNKLINLCLLKDHQSAGVTLALKNLSHGLVNNVNRSHGTNTLNACGAFIPAVVAMPVIRNKTVLHIMDGVKGVYHGGPPAQAQFVWEHKTMYFATDPVALDHVGWRAIDAQRAKVGMKPVAEDLPDKHSTFLRRQPEHVEIAGALGLGVFDWDKIDLRRFTL